MCKSLANHLLNSEILTVLRHFYPPQTAIDFRAQLFQTFHLLTPYTQFANCTLFHSHRYCVMLAFPKWDSATQSREQAWPIYSHSFICFDLGRSSLLSAAARKEEIHVREGAVGRSVPALPSSRIFFLTAIACVLQFMNYSTCRHYFSRKLEIPVKSASLCKNNAVDTITCMHYHLQLLHII